MAFNRLTTEQTIAVHTRLSLLETQTMTLADATKAIADAVEFPVTESNVKRIADAAKLTFKGARGPRVEPGAADMAILARSILVLLSTPPETAIEPELGRELQRIAMIDKQAPGTLFDATV